MNIKAFLKNFETALQSNSGYNNKRDYLGMSRLHDCPRKVVRDFHLGVHPSPQLHRMSLRGYAVQSAVFPIYVKAGLVRPDSAGHEINAKFNSVFPDWRTPLLGHVDGVLLEGNGILEIKSLKAEKWEERREVRKADPIHYKQVQTYMHFGHYQECVLDYWNMDTFENYQVFLTYREEVGADIEAKAIRILQAIEKKELPPCECGNCKS